MQDRVTVGPMQTGETATVDTRTRRAGATSVAVLALVGGMAMWMLARPAPEAVGAARLRSPEIALATFDTIWLLLLAVPSAASWPAAVTKLVVGAPFHVAIAAAGGAGPQFHGAWALVAAAFAAVGVVGTRAAPTVHGVATSLAAFALPLAAYAAGEFGGADVRAVFLASPTVAPTLLARTSTIATVGDAVPSLVVATLVLAADLAAARRRRAGG
jgi:hypothetical protein